MNANNFVSGDDLKDEKNRPATGSDFMISGRSGEQKGQRRPSNYERTMAAVYATGNKWAIENFHATHD